MNEKDRKDVEDRRNDSDRIRRHVKGRKGEERGRKRERKEKEKAKRKGKGERERERERGKEKEKGKKKKGILGRRTVLRKKVERTSIFLFFSNFLF